MAARWRFLVCALIVACADPAGGQLVLDGESLTTNEDQTIAVGNAVHGTASLASGFVTFTPEAGYTGTATFEYTVSDGQLTDIGLVTVTVTP